MKVAFIAALKPFNFALWALLIVVLGVAGPFGTFELIPFDERLRYWGMIVVVSALMGYQASFFSETLTTGKHPILTDLLTTLLLALFLTPVNLWITHWLVVPDVPDEGPKFVDMAIYVSAVSFALMTSRRLIPGLEEQNYLPDTQDDTIPRLMRRLPDRVQTQILRISSEGHFVCIVTECGVQRLRMRLADAIAEMDGVNGYWTHRSHWVATSAISQIEKESGRIQLLLNNGDRVPVSRKYKADLEAAGVL